MIENALMDYGIIGVFISYLIYDRTILLKKLTNIIEENTDVLREIKVRGLNHGRRK